MAMSTAEENDVPATIEIERDSHVHLEWPDGLVADLPIDALRLACQCANCRSIRDAGRPVVPRPPAGQPLEVVGADLVGAYALSITWNDPSCQSIYSYDQLRRWSEELVSGPPSFGGSRPEDDT